MIPQQSSLFHPGSRRSASLAIALPPYKFSAAVTGALFLAASALPVASNTDLMSTSLYLTLSTNTDLAEENFNDAVSNTEEQACSTASAIGATLSGAYIPEGPPVIPVERVSASCPCDNSTTYTNDPTQTSCHNVVRSSSPTSQNPTSFAVPSQITRSSRSQAPSSAPLRNISLDLSLISNPTLTGDERMGLTGVLVEEEGTSLIIGATYERPSGWSSTMIKIRKVTSHDADREPHAKGVTFLQHNSALGDGSPNAAKGSNAVRRSTFTVAFDVNGSNRMLMANSNPTWCPGEARDSSRK